jgi:hypothetical protein
VVFVPKDAGVTGHLPKGRIPHSLDQTFGAVVRKAVGERVRLAAMLHLGALEHHRRLQRAMGLSHCKVREKGNLLDAPRHDKPPRPHARTANNLGGSVALGAQELNAAGSYRVVSVVPPYPLLQLVDADGQVLAPQASKIPLDDANVIWSEHPVIHA